MARRPNPYALLLSGAVAVAIVAIGSPAAAVPAPPARIDYNWDSWGDIVVGQRDRTVGGLSHAGAVSVVYGSPSGLTSTGSQYIDQNSAGVPGKPEASGQFGASIVSGHFDGLDYASVAISAPGANANDGSVVALYGGASGLHAGAWTQAKAELLLPRGFYQTNASQFGQSLATARFDGDGYGDLVVGITDFVSGGRLLVLRGSINGLLPAAGWYLISQQSLGLPLEADAGLGYTQAVGDFNGDDRPDLAAGMPFRDLNGLESTGEVVVLLTGADGVIGSAGVVVINKDTPGVAGTPGVHNHFGLELAAGDITGDGIDELVVGMSGPTSVLVLLGTPNGPTGIGSVGFSDPIAGDLAVLDTDGDPYHELAIGVANANGPAGSGAVTVLPGTPTGPSPVGTQWSQNTTGIPDSAESNDHFGYELLGLQDDFGGIEHLVVGVPDESFLFCTGCGAIHELRAGPGGLSAAGTVFITSQMVAAGASTGEDFGGTLG